MDEKKYILHFASGNKIISEKEAIANAIKQKNSGVTPLYKRSGSDARGWLVWSTFEDCRAIFLFDFLPEMAANPPFWLVKVCQMWYNEGI